MLKDDLEQMKRENPVGLEVQTGGCKFCGQMAQIATLLPWNDEMCNEAATELCECWEAKSYTHKKGQKERALKAIKKQFGPEAGEMEVDETIITLLENIVELIVEDTIDSTTVDIGNGLKAKISITAKGFIKVERTKTEKATQEA